MSITNIRCPIQERLPFKKPTFPKNLEKKTFMPFELKVNLSSEAKVKNDEGALPLTYPIRNSLFAGSNSDLSPIKLERTKKAVQVF